MIHTRPPGRGLSGGSARDFSLVRMSAPVVLSFVFLSHKLQRIPIRRALLMLQEYTIFPKTLDKSSFLLYLLTNIGQPIGADRKVLVHRNGVGILRHFFCPDTGHGKENSGTGRRVYIG